MDTPGSMLPDPGAALDVFDAADAAATVLDLANAVRAANAAWRDHNDLDAAERHAAQASVLADELAGKYAAMRERRAPKPSLRVL